MTKAQKWHNAVKVRDYGTCQAQRHDHRCRGVGEHAHHICFRSQIPDYTHWTVIENGIWLSLYCHDLAHRRKNKNIAFDRVLLATEAINYAILDGHPKHKMPLRELWAA